MPRYNRPYNTLPELTNYTTGEGATSLLMRMMAIQQNRKDKERQAELDRVAAEDRARQQKQEDEDRALKATILQQTIAAATERPKEAKTTTVANVDLKPPEPPPLTPLTPEEQALQDATGTPAPEDLRNLDLGVSPTAAPQGTPDSLPLQVTSMERTPTPTRQVQFGGQTLDVPMRDLTDIQTQKDEEARKALSLELEKQSSLLGQMIQLPEDDRLGDLSGKSIPKALLPMLPSMMKHPATGSFEDFVIRKYGDNPSPAQLEDARKIWAEQGHVTVNVPKDKRKWVTKKNKDGSTERVFITEEEIATAPPGLYSDIKQQAPKADSKGLETARRMVGTLGDPDSIMSLVTRINTHEGVAGRVTGLIQKGKAALGTANDVQLYQDQLAGFASQLAKAFGESGRLSDQDIQRTTNMFPRVGDGAKLTTRKMLRIYKMLEVDPAAVLEAIHGGAPLPDVPGGAAPGPAAPGAGPTTITSDAEFDALPSGAEFKGPDGVLRRKP